MELDDCLNHMLREITQITQRDKALREALEKGDYHIAWVHAKQIEQTAILLSDSAEKCAGKCQRTITPTTGV